MSGSGSSSNKSQSGPCHILFRSKDGVELYPVHEGGDSSGNDSVGRVLAKGLSTIHCFSPDGKKVLIHMPSVGVIQRNVDGGADASDDDDDGAFLTDSRGVQFMSFSTKGSYIVTWERAVKQTDASSAPPPNLKVWNATTGKLLHGFQMRTMKRDQWPPLKWTHDEGMAFHMVSNELHVYQGHAFSNTPVRFESKIRSHGITNFTVPSTFGETPNSLTSKGTYLLTAFVPENKGKPARISLLRYPTNCGTAENPTSGPSLASKSFFQAEECSVKWSPKGDAALVLTHTTVDSSGDSYYGSTNLYLLLSQNQKLEGEALSVPLPSSPSSHSPSTGPVLDVSWMPNPNKPSCFALISGRMPAMASLHHGTTGEPTFLFGNAHRNTIVWSQHGRFLALAGFGNLAGGMDFYDRNKLKPMPQYHPQTGANLNTTGNTASCAVGYGWSPTSRYFMVSTTTPRMNVDNGVTLYKYNGLQLTHNTNPHDTVITWDNAKYQPDKLLAAEFVPSPFGTYPDRPQSPPPKLPDGVIPSSTSTSTSTSNPTDNAKTKTTPTPLQPAAYVPPAGRYVPPAARRAGTGGGGTSLAERMRREREGTTITATKVSSSHSKLPVGMVPKDTSTTNNTKSKSALRKEKQRLAKQKAEEAEREEAKRKEAEEKERAAANAADPEKRAKKLKKLLKQIEDLKGKDVKDLNEDQKRKISTEDDVRQELAQLGI